MPARSVKITIHNATGIRLTKMSGSKSGLCHGDFTSPFNFPHSIESGSSQTWEAESSGDIPIIGSIATGTEGWVKFQFDGLADVVTIYWTNPFIGNTFFGYSADASDIIDPQQKWNAACGDNNIQTGGSTFTIGPSRFKFFPVRLVPDTQTTQDKAIGVTKGPLDAQGGTILPLPGQQELWEHAWFEIGIFDSSGASLKLVTQAMGFDPSKGIKASIPSGLTSLKPLRFKALLDAGV